MYCISVYLQINEYTKQSFVDKQGKERERSQEQLKKAREDYERELQLEEDRKYMEREKERKKKEAADKAAQGILEVQIRKHEIDQMHN